MVSWIKTLKSKFVISIISNLNNCLKDGAELKLFIYISSSCYSDSPLSSKSQLIPFTTEEITDCSNEATKGANKASGNLPSCFFLFHVLLFQICFPNLLMIL